jgi:hypothetical protein
MVVCSIAAPFLILESEMRIRGMVLFAVVSGSLCFATWGFAQNDKVGPGGIQAPPDNPVPQPFEGLRFDGAAQGDARNGAPFMGGGRGMAPGGPAGNQAPGMIAGTSPEDFAKKMIQQYDANGNGELDQNELANCLKFLHEQAMTQINAAHGGQQAGPGIGVMPGGGGGPARGGPGGRGMPDLPGVGNGPGQNFNGGGVGEGGIPRRGRR